MELVYGSGSWVHGGLDLFWLLDLKLKAEIKTNESIHWI
jgi:hypothetical protein